MKKKLITRLLVILLSALLAGGCFISCAEEPEDVRAVRLYEKAEEKAAGAVSYTMKGTMTFTFTAGGQETTVTAAITQKTVSSPALRVTEETKTTVSAAGIPAGEEEVRLDGFMDGRAFRLADGVGLYAEMTAEDYLAWRASASDINADDLSALLPHPEQAAEKLCAEDEETGDFTVTLKGVGKDNLTVLASGMDSLTDTLDVTLDDVDVTILIGKDKSFKRITADYRFSGGEELPTASLVMEFSGWDGTTVEDVAFDGKYEQAYDIRLPGLAVDAYAATIGADRFTAESRSEVVIAGQTQVVAEKDDVTVRDGDTYTFDIDALVGTDHYTMTYANGTQTTKDKSGQTVASAQMTESEARVFIRQLIDPLSFKDTYVRSVKQPGSDGRVEMTLTSEALASVKQQLTAGGLTVGSGTGTMTLTLGDDGSIREIAVVLTLNISMSGYDGRTTISYKLTVPEKAPQKTQGDAV